MSRRAASTPDRGLESTGRGPRVSSAAGAIEACASTTVSTAASSPSTCSATSRTYLPRSPSSNRRPGVLARRLHDLHPHPGARRGARQQLARRRDRALQRGHDRDPAAAAHRHLRHRPIHAHHRHAHPVRATLRRAADRRARTDHRLHRRRQTLQRRAHLPLEARVLRAGSAGPLQQIRPHQVAVLHLRRDLAHQRAEPPNMHIGRMQEPERTHRRGIIVRPAARPAQRRRSTPTPHAPQTPSALTASGTAPARGRGPRGPPAWLARPLAARPAMVSLPEWR